MGGGGTRIIILIEIVILFCIFFSRFVRDPRQTSLSWEIVSNQSMNGHTPKRIHSHAHTLFGWATVPTYPKTYNNNNVRTLLAHRLKGLPTKKGGIRDTQTSHPGFLIRLSGLMIQPSRIPIDLTRSVSNL